MGRKITHFALRVCVGLAGVALSSILLWSQAGSSPSDQTVYMTAPLEQVKAQLADCTRLGRQNGSTYYFKPAGIGIGQIFKVLDSDQTKYAAVGVLVNGKFTHTIGES